MKPLYIGTSPLTNRIFCGHLLKDGCAWAPNRKDVTEQAVGAVVEHVITAGGCIVLSINGEPAYEIKVRAIKKTAGNGEEE